jgi:Mn-dependent DtxR family transcriptional regulator
MGKYPGASLATLADKLKWFTKDGKPYKMLVQRMLKALQKDKLVKMESGRWVLTKAGEKKAEIVAVDDDPEIPF